MSIIDNKYKPIGYAILAALLYSLSSPISKLLLTNISPTMMASFLYLGAGIGISILAYIQKFRQKEIKELPLSKAELPYTAAMVILDIIAPILLMIGLTMTSAANVSLLNNFEIVATSLIALLFFKEKISTRLWIGIIFVTLSTIVLSVQGQEAFNFSIGSFFVILASICWGIENNCTRKLSSKDPMQIVIIKGLCSGLGALIISLSIGEKLPSINYIIIALFLGFIAYGLSIMFYIRAQRELGAAKTSTFYAVAPFIGVFLSLIIFLEVPSSIFIIAFILMMIGTYYASSDH